ncbi:helix-turn-helix transcriptional regulator [Microbacterium sp. GXF7504]
MREYRAESARAGLESLTGAGLALDEYMDEALVLIRRAVPADAACFATVDPSTVMLSASHRHDLENSGGADFFFYEYAVGEDVALFADLARRTFGVGILRDETGGDPARSTRYSNLVRPVIGAEHELRGVARRGGTTWGAFALYRTAGSPPFNAAEAEFMHRLERTLADGLRAGMATSTAETARNDQGPAILVFDRDGRLQFATDTARARVAGFDGDLDADLATPVAAVLSRLRHGEECAPRLRAQHRDGEWYVFQAARFRDADGRVSQYAVTIEPAAPPDIVPLLMMAYGLTERETRIVQAMMRGEATHAIAQALHLSPYTVQDHFKSIFAKFGVSSRREVASRLTATVYAGAD